MDAHKQLVEQLFRDYQSSDHDAMSACYHDRATFTDIAFRLKGRKEIHAMWHLICAVGIEVQVQSVEVDGKMVRARIIDRYTMSDTRRTIVNKIDSAFEFRDGLIIAQRDNCDALEWARLAFGGLKGEIAGRFGMLRRMVARKKMRAFIAAHPEHA